MLLCIGVDWHIRNYDTTVLPHVQRKKLAPGDFACYRRTRARVEAGRQPHPPPLAQAPTVIARARCHLPQGGRLFGFVDSAEAPVEATASSTTAGAAVPLPPGGKVANGVSRRGEHCSPALPQSHSAARGASADAQGPLTRCAGAPPKGEPLGCGELYYQVQHYRK